MCPAATSSAPPSLPPPPYPVTFVAPDAEVRRLLGVLFSVIDFADSYLQDANISF